MGDQMGKVKFVFHVGLIVLGISVGLPISNADGEVRDLGYVCITVSYDGLFRPPETHVFGALAYGAQQRYIVLTAALVPFFLEHGSAALIGDTIMVTFSSSNEFGDFFTTSTTNILLSASTLTGRVATVTTQLLPSLLSSKLTGTANVFSCN